MSAEYLLKMEALRRSREELTARRLEIERRIALREATAAEYSAIALQSSKQKWKSLRASAIAAKKRNDDFIREVRDAQRKIDEVYVRTTQKLWPSDNQLELEKARYLRKVEELYPAWQEKMQAVRVQTLRELEEKKRAIEKRRYLAKKTFETEQTLDDLIQQTSHEIGLAENLEKNEAFEREVLRNQSALQAMRLDESIREHATGARMYMKQQAVEQLAAAQHVNNDVEDQIFETFSPRGAVKAMRQANNAIKFVEHADNNAEDAQQRQPRSQRIAIPNTQRRSREPENPLPDPYVDTKMDESDPTTSARSWARSGVTSGHSVLSHRSSKRHVTSSAHSLGSMTDKSTPAVDTHNAYRRTEAPQPAELYVVADERARVVATTRSDATHETVSSYGRNASFESERNAELAASFQKLSTVTGVSSVLKPATMQGHDSTTPPLQSSSRPATRVNDDRELATLKSGFMALAAATQNPPPGSLSDRLLMQQSPVKDGYGIERSPSYPDRQDGDQYSVENSGHPRHGGAWTPNLDMSISASILSHHTEEDKYAPEIRPFDVYKVVEHQHNQGRSIETKEEEKPSATWDYESKKPSPAKTDAVCDHSDLGQNDLSLNLINSFESNQSSIMDFSVGKLLQTPLKSAFGSNVTDAPDKQPSPVAPTPANASSSPIGGILLASVGVGSIENEVASRPKSIEKQQSESSNPVALSPEHKGTSNFEVRRQEPALASFVPTHNTESSLLFSSLESASGIGSPASKLEGDTMIESVSDFGSPVSALKSPPTPQKGFAVVEVMSSSQNSPPQSPTDQEPPADAFPSLFATLSMPERLKALTALIARVEEGVNEGEQLSGPTDNETSRDTKRELLRIAVSGRKAQINFFGSDVCFELVVDLARELGSVLFPGKAFEGILNDQKMKKVHQNGKEKEADIWKAFAAHMKQLHAAKAIPVSSLVDLFTSAFLSHDQSNQRSLRKLRELLFSVCGATESASARPAAAISPSQGSESTEPIQPRGSVSMERETASSPQIPTLLQTAFLQTASPPKTKTYGIASSSFKKRSSSEDVLKSMASSPARLSLKLMRGGKMGDYSEFEEEDAVDLDNLIGTKPSMASSSHSGTIANAAKSTGRGVAASAASSSRFGSRDDKDDFDVDF